MFTQAQQQERERLKANCPPAHNGQGGCGGCPACNDYYYLYASLPVAQRVANLNTESKIWRGVREAGGGPDEVMQAITKFQTDFTATWAMMQDNARSNATTSPHTSALSADNKGDLSMCYRCEQARSQQVAVENAIKVLQDNGILPPPLSPAAQEYAAGLKPLTAAEKAHAQLQGVDPVRYQVAQNPPRWDFGNAKSKLNRGRK